MRRAVFGARSSRARIAPRGRLARAQLEHLAEQHQNGNDGSGFEIDRHRAVMPAEGRRKQTGRQRRDRAVDPGDAGAHRDQREHVEIARDQRTASRARRTASPPTARPAWRARTGSSWTASDSTPVCAEEMAGHFEHDDRKRERKPDPEAPRHVGKLGIGAGVGGGQFGLERHAADRAGARPDLADLRMHRAGVDGAGRRRARRFALCRDTSRGSAGEFRAAAGRAEIIGVAVVLVRCGVVCGSTVMPQTGSSALFFPPAAAGAAGAPSAAAGEGLVIIQVFRR